MWNLFKEKMNTGDKKYFINLMSQDIYVYKILKFLIG